jgi:hypothetical protein
MAVVIPTNYPIDCTDEEIIRVIRELSQEMIAGGGNINTVMQFTPLITVGQAELQKRVLHENNSTTEELHAETVQLKTITENYSKSSEQFAKSSRILSMLAIIISIISLLALVYFGFKSNQSDKVWQNEQLKILKDINSNLKLNQAYK